MTITQQQIERLKRVNADTLSGIHFDDLAAAAETLEKLPVTADGVCVVPGMEVFCGDDIDPRLVTGVTNYAACPGLQNDPEAERSFFHAGNDCHQNCDAATDTDKCYSTREAAEAARKDEV